MESQDTRAFVIDTDGGVDDSMALVVGLGFLNIQAITGVAGNVEIDKVVINVAKVLEVGDMRIPIYKGAGEPMVKDAKTATFFHGEDGLSDHPDVQAMTGYTDLINEDVHAVQYLIDRAKESNFNLIGLGPLTNVALALCLYPKLTEAIDNLYVMGGTIHGKGNMEFNLEYNFYADPEAAHKVFKHFKCVHLIPWEASPEFVIPDEYMDELLSLDTPKAKFLKATHSGQLKRLNKIMIGDAFTPMVAIDPTICDEINELQAKVYTQGDAAGQISYAWPQHTFHYNASKANCRVYHKFNVEKTCNMLFKVLR